MKTRIRSVSLTMFAFIALLAVQSVAFGQTISNGPFVQLGGTTNVRIVWYTNVATVNNCVQHSLNQSSWWQVCAGPQSCQPAVGCRNEVTLSRLNPETVYFYRILSGAPGQIRSRSCDGRALFQFQTNRPDYEGFRFVAFGDSGEGCLDACTPQEDDAEGFGQCQISRRISQLDPRPNFIMHTGDLVYSGIEGGDGSFQRYPAAFFKPYRNLIEEMAFYPSLGNHDSDPFIDPASPPFLRIFSLPQNGPLGTIPGRNYTFDYGNTSFIAIDSNASQDSLSNMIAPWVAQNLQRTSKRWKFAFFHHPVYSSGPHGETSRMQASLSQVFANKGADIVFQGHDHTYERIASTAGRSYGLNFGPKYIVTGAGGQLLYERASRREYSEFFCGPDGPGGTRDCDRVQHSFTRVDVEGPNLSLEQVGANNCRIDILNLNKAVAKEDELRYLRGVSPGPPANWMRPEFVENANWLSGVTPFGYCAVQDGCRRADSYDDIATDFLTDMRGQYLTVYFRKTFDVDDVMALFATEVKLRLDYNDGFVAFLNGVEVARANLPINQDYRTPASRSHPAGSFETYLVNPAVLRNGRNVLAIEVHNVSLSNPQYYFNADLTLSYAEPGYCP